MAVASRAKPVRVPKAGEMIAAELRRQVILGELREGDALPSETELMEQFGVSRPTLREAFRILEFEGILSIRRGAGGGGRVHLPDLDVAARTAGLLLQHSGTTLAEVYEARAMVEPAVVGQVARRRTNADLARLDEALTAQQEALGDADASFAADRAFHDLIIELAHNRMVKVLVGITNQIVELGDRHYAQTHAAEVQMPLAKAALRTHTKVVELIRAKQGDEAEALWGRHLTDSARIVLEGRATTVVELLRSDAMPGAR